jgi:hypothetical protein
MQRIISKYNAVRDEILRTATPSTADFDTVMRPYAEFDNAMQGKLGMIYMLQYAATDMATQDAIPQARELLLKAEALWAAQ